MISLYTLVFSWLMIGVGVPACTMVLPLTTETPSESEPAKDGEEDGVSEDMGEIQARECLEVVPECPSLNATVCLEETRVTPRQDRTAEILALELSQQPIAPQAMYDRILADLENLRSLFPDVASVSVFPSVMSTDVIVRLTDEAAALHEAGEYSEWDCLNALYRMNVAWRLLSSPVFLLESDGRFNTSAIAGDYAQLAGVDVAAPNSAGGDGSDICVLADGDVHLYVFDHGSGDCPAGCAEHSYWGFSTDSYGDIVELGSFRRGEDAPPWFPSACLDWL